MHKQLDPLSYVTLQEIEEELPCPRGYAQFLNHFRLRPSKDYEGEIIEERVDYRNPNVPQLTRTSGKRDLTKRILLSDIARVPKHGYDWIAWLLLNLQKFQDLRDEIEQTGASGDYAMYQKFLELADTVRPQFRDWNVCLREYVASLRKEVKRA